MSDLDSTTQKPHLVVVGLGYVGLPLAQAAVRAGYAVTGLDRSSVVVEGLNRGVSHVDDLSDSEIGDMLVRGFVATVDEGALGQANAVVICVPTPLAVDGSPDLLAVTSAGAAVARHLQRGTLVVLESTTAPGTTEEVLAPVLAQSGLVLGEDFFLAFSPERVDPGNETFNITNTPKVVGGATPRCAAAAAEFYGRIVDTVVLAKGTREAETAKLLENTYRHINIALVNEMARVCHEMNIDVWDVIRCAETKPFGFQAFRPGPGVGGHCIPIDPNYLSHAVKTSLGYPLRFVELAQEINQTMPAYVFRRIQDLLNQDAVAVNGARVLVVGVTYKANIADQRESPADALFDFLSRSGALVEFHDPMVGGWSPGGVPVPRVEALSADEYDVAVILQHHDAIDSDQVVKAARRILDTRGKLDAPNVERL
ncbi:nucleotide sugar dehydrogenase [Nocardioides sp.]|uniref:nucleotide sugar dehydrogenase n=1 Tax=Nocardioides sp. TaxID=35761 RepID=UPI003D0CAAD9